MGGMHLTHRACEIFVHLALDLTQRVKKGVFLEGGQVLVSQPHGMEPKLA
jgi:hypothetical protein